MTVLRLTLLAFALAAALSGCGRRGSLEGVGPSPDPAALGPVDVLPSAENPDFEEPPKGPRRPFILDPLI